jgi:hypothetical protein
MLAHSMVAWVTYTWCGTTAVFIATVIVATCWRL